MDVYMITVYSGVSVYNLGYAWIQKEKYNLYFVNSQLAIMLLLDESNSPRFEPITERTCMDWITGTQCFFQMPSHCSIDHSLPVSSAPPSSEARLHPILWYWRIFCDMKRPTDASRGDPNPAIQTQTRHCSPWGTCFSCSTTIKLDQQLLYMIP